MGETADVTVSVQPPNSVVLVVGREEFTLPTSFDGATAVGTTDCIALGVRSADDGPTSITVTVGNDPESMQLIGEFELKCEGLLFVRDVYSRELLTVGVEPGISRVAIWGNDPNEPDQVVVVLSSAGRSG